MRRLIRSGFLVAAACVVAGSSMSAATVETPEHLGSLAAILTTEPATRALGLTKSQISQINLLRQDLKKSSRAVVATHPSNKQEVMLAEAKLEALRKASNDKVIAVLSPVQKQQLLAVEAKAAGGTVLELPSVQKTLALSPSQIKKISSISAQGAAFARTVNLDYREGKIDNFERLDVLRTERVKRASELLNVLTPGQRGQFDKLIKA